MGFTDVVNSCDIVIFEAWKHRFFEGWMVAVNALNLPKSSPFKDPTQIPLPNDMLVQAPTNEQFDEEGDEEGEDSPNMRELAKQIKSHVEVIDVDNPTSLGSLFYPPYSCPDHIP